MVFLAIQDLKVPSTLQSFMYQRTDSPTYDRNVFTRGHLPSRSPAMVKLDSRSDDKSPRRSYDRKSNLKFQSQWQPTEGNLGISTISEWLQQWQQCLRKGGPFLLGMCKCTKRNKLGDEFGVKNIIYNQGYNQKISTSDSKPTGLLVNPSPLLKRLQGRGIS